MTKPNRMIQAARNHLTEAVMLRGLLAKIPMAEEFLTPAQVPGQVVMIMRPMLQVPNRRRSQGTPYWGICEHPNQAWPRE